MIAKKIGITKVLSRYQARAQAFEHAVVIGSGIAGLTAARVLTNYFAQVTIIERDHLDGTVAFRPGVPQARHAHTLPLRGQALLEQQFPGLLDELLAHDASLIKPSSEMAFFLADHWHKVRHHPDSMSITFSRPLLETIVYQRLAAHPKITVLQRYEVVGLAVDSRAERVVGVRLRNRRELAARETELEADLVVDTSGRGSRAPQWLANLGYPSPREEIINSFSGYASRIYQRPANIENSWKTLYIKPTAPHGTRGGIIIPIEGDRWHVTLIGMAGDYPAIDEEGFLAFARSLPTPQLYEAVRDAIPLTSLCGYRRTENRLRHYDELPRYLEGFLACGDAVYALNPVYAQGMTAATISSTALDWSLQVIQANSHLTGLAKMFQQQLSKVVAGPWEMAVREDRRWPATTEAAGAAEVKQRQHRVRQARSRTTTGISYQVLSHLPGS